jgi:taurine dioxygenase
MYAAYEDLAGEDKRHLDTLVAVHDLDYSRRQTDARRQMSEEQKRNAPPVEWPIVRTHPETGRKALYVNFGHTVRFRGMTEQESAPLLGYLFQHQVKPEFTCRFRWKVGSLAFWDNRCTQHNPVNDYHGHRRVMHRITLAGDKPR